MVDFWDSKHTQTYQKAFTYTFQTAVSNNSKQHHKTQIILNIKIIQHQFITDNSQCRILSPRLQHIYTHKHHSPPLY